MAGRLIRLEPSDPCCCYGGRWFLRRNTTLRVWSLLQQHEFEWIGRPLLGLVPSPVEQVVAATQQHAPATPSPTWLMASHAQEAPAVLEPASPQVRLAILVRSSNCLWGDGSILVQMGSFGPSK